MGAGVSTALTLAINNDLFEGAEAEVRLARLATVMLFVPMLAPAAGTAVTYVGGWRGIYVLLTALGLLLGCIIWGCFEESARRAAGPSGLTGLLRGYTQAIHHRTCLIELLRFLCPQIIIAKTLGAWQFSPLEVPDQINAMISRFRAVGITRRSDATTG